MKRKQIAALEFFIQGEDLDVVFHQGQWIYRDEGMGEWYSITDEDLDYLYDLMNSDPPMSSFDVYSHWCAAFAGEFFCNDEDVSEQEGFPDAYVEDILQTRKEVNHEM